jgi:hypothetical protein
MRVLMRLHLLLLSFFIPILLFAFLPLPSSGENTITTGLCEKLYLEGKALEKKGASVEAIAKYQEV